MSVREHACALLEFLCGLDLEARLLSRADLLRERGELGAAEDNERLWGIIVDTLDKVVRVLPDFQVNATAFSSLLSIAFSSKTVMEPQLYL
jgi:ATP-dependent helicase/DNAse subunit B